MIHILPKVSSAVEMPYSESDILEHGLNIFLITSRAEFVYFTLDGHN